MPHSLRRAFVVPGGVAPPRPCPFNYYASSARLARHENSLADRVSYLWDRTLALSRRYANYDLSLSLCYRPVNIFRTAVRASAFSGGSPIEILAQRSYGGNARPMSIPSLSSNSANSACGMPASKKTKLPLDAVAGAFNSLNR